MARQRTVLADPAKRVSPTRTEPMARDVAGLLGGAPGRFARVGTQRFWTPLRVLIVVALSFLSLGFLAKANCIQGTMIDGVAQLDWSGNRQYTSACYNDIVPLYGARGLDQPGFPYAYSFQEGELTRYMEYPVLAGIFQWIMGLITQITYPIIEILPFAIPEVAHYFAITALVMSAMWIVVIRLVAELTGNRVWDTMLVAASPLVVMHAFTNWDIPSVLCAVLALWCLKQRNVTLSGVAIGLGTAFKLWPLFLLGAFLVLAIRSSKVRDFFTMVGATVVTWLVINVPVWLAYPDAWAEFGRLNSTRGWEWTTIYALLGRQFGWSGFDGGATPPVILNAFTFIAFVGLCVAIGVFGVKVVRRPRVAELGYLIVAAFLLVNKVWSPQYSLWLVVLAALALPRWRLLFAWMLIDALTWPVLMWHMMGEDQKGVPGALLDLFVLGRDGLIIAIAVLIIRQMLGKHEDPVRAAHGGEDPLAGSFGQRDTFVLGGSPVNSHLDVVSVPALNSGLAAQKDAEVKESMEAPSGVTVEGTKPKNLDEKK